MRCSVNRLLQLATKPRLQSTRSDTSSQVWPSASSKISRARRASSARSVRLLARRVSSISSEFVNVIVSLIDTIIVYKWLLQSTRFLYVGGFGRSLYVSRAFLKGQGQSSLGSIPIAHSKIPDDPISFERCAGKVTASEISPARGDSFGMLRFLDHQLFGADRASHSFQRSIDALRMDSGPSH